MLPGARDQSDMDDLTKLALQVTQLRQALGYFLDDERFKIQVGGNPGMVEWMLRRATAVYNSTSSR